MTVICEDIRGKLEWFHTKPNENFLELCGFEK